MQWYDILMLLGVPSIICVIFSTIWTRMLSKHGKAKAEAEEKEKKIEEDIALLKQANQAQLQTQLYDMGERLTKRKYASYLEKQCYEKMYNSYHKLGNNGVMTDLYNEVMMLPNEKPIKPVRKRV